MMKFGAFGAIGTVVAIQAGDYHQNVDNVRNELGNMFNHLVHEVDHSTHKVEHLQHVETDLKHLRKADGLTMKNVQKEAEEVDREAQHLMSEHDRLVHEDHELRERKDGLNHDIHHWNDQAHTWNEAYHNWMHFQHLTHERIGRANTINSLLTFIHQSLPHLYENQMNVCVESKEYINYYTYGSTNYQDPLEHHLVHMLRDVCQYDIKKFTIGKDEYAYCVVSPEGG